MPIAPTDYKDVIGTGKGEYGAQTQLKMQQRSLKQYNAGAAQFSNTDPNTAPGPQRPPSPQQVAQSVPTPPPASAAPAGKPAIQGADQPQAPRGFGPSSGLGVAPGQSPVSPAATPRGFGPDSGLAPPDQQPAATQPVPPNSQAWQARSMSDAFRQLAALPGASPVIQMYARLAAQKAQQP